MIGSWSRVCGVVGLAAAICSGGNIGAAAEDPARTVQEGVPQGRITDGVFEESRLFPGTRRDYRVYLPAQHRPGTPARLMVFMDGLN